MVFADLSIGIQNLMLLQFEFLGKVILLLILTVFSFFYVKNFKQKSKTAYKFTKIFKGLIYIMSWVTLVLSPLFVLFLFPEVPFSDILQLFVVGYSIFITITGTLISLNMIYYGTHFLMDFFGMENETKTGKKEFKRVFGKGGILE